MLALNKRATLIEIGKKGLTIFKCSKTANDVTVFVLRCSVCAGIWGNIYYGLKNGTFSFFIVITH